MSTRVHELARELNVRSQEVLEFLKAEGEQIKSVLASLESHQIDRVRKKFAGAGGSAGADSANEPPVTTEPAKFSTPVAAEPAAHVINKPAAEASRPSVAPVTPIKPNVPPVGGGLTTQPVARPAAPQPPARPPVSSLLGTPPAASRPPEPQRPPTQPPTQGQYRPQQHAPMPPRPGQPPMGPRPGGGPPQQGHNAGRPTTVSSGLHRPGQPPVSQRSAPAVPISPDQPAAPVTQAPAQASAQPKPPEPATPFRRDHYIGPSGVRQSIPQPGVPQRPPERRPQPEGGPQEPRRQTPRPQMATPSPSRTFAPTGSAGSQGPVHRSDQKGGPRPGQGPGQGGGPRPGMPSPPAGGGSYQRPDKKFTPDQLKAMMQSGQIGGIPSAPKPGQPAGMAGSKPTPSGVRPAMGQPVGQPAGAGSALAPKTLGPAPAGPIDDEEEQRKNKAGAVGERAARRVQREKRQRDRVTSPVSVDAVLGAVDEEEARQARRKIHHKSKSHAGNQLQRKDNAEIQTPITVRSLSEAIGVKANEIMSLLFRQGKAVRINDSLPDASAVELAMEFGVDLKIIHERTAEDDLLDAFVDETIEGDKVPRPPIITILGHVDHGKTSLLDRIRKSDVAAHESGGITQHIGAYQVNHNGHAITFLDTPGHEAFTSMRARGANVTDVVVLVVAADDGVMPQTEEAISHAKAAEVPIIVALNKVDLPNVNYNRIFGELSQHGLVPEEYGGDTLVVKTSAHTGLGIADLLENLLLVAELKELKGNPDRPAVGTCLESQVSEGRGVVATMLVQDGTLRIGDVLVCGDGYGRVRAMFNHRGEPVEVAGPSMPVEVSGLDAVPEAGEKFAVLPDLSRAREISETRKTRSRELERSERSAVTLENLFDRMNEQRVRSLNIILKADVQGSLEALTKELEKLENTEIPIRILHRAVGGITESDVQLANASQAIIIGFRVAPEDRAMSLADDKKIDIRRYDIIYQVTDEVKKAIEGMLVPEIKETHLGRAAVRQVFKISKVGTVAGCFVTQGLIERSAKIRLLREGREIYKGSLEALKRFKDDVKEVREGFECGIRISNYDDIKTDDIIEAYKIEEIRRTL